MNNILNQLTNRQDSVAGTSGSISQSHNTFIVPPQPTTKKKSKIKEKVSESKTNPMMNGPVNIMGQYSDVNNAPENPTAIPELDEIIDTLAVGKSDFDPSSRIVEEMVTDMIKHEQHFKQKSVQASSVDHQCSNPLSYANVSTVSMTMSNTASLQSQTSNVSTQSNHILHEKSEEVDAQDLLNIPLHNFLTGGTEYQPPASQSIIGKLLLVKHGE